MQYILKMKGLNHNAYSKSQFCYYYVSTSTFLSTQRKITNVCQLTQLRRNISHHTKRAANKVFNKNRVKSIFCFVLS